MLIAIMPGHPKFHFHLKRKPPVDSQPEDCVPFECKFESLVERLAALPGMFIELDGSFVFRSQGATENEITVAGSQVENWQMDGMIYDRTVADDGGKMAARVMWCEIRGQFPKEVWEQVLDCMETPVEDLIAVQLDQGVSVPISELFN